MSSKLWTTLGCFFAFLGVLLGAFGAHALKNSLTEYSRGIYQTAVQYQFIHALALIGLGLWASHSPAGDPKITGIAFVIGIILFSGSLYLLALTDQKSLGAITPIGGVAFLLGWLTFAWSAWKS